MMKKPAALSAGLVAIKGNVAPAHDMPSRSASVSADSGGLQPLNFRVRAEFRREFKAYAAAHDLKLNELLRRSFEAYRKQQED
jgi:hypothetical protein